MSDPFEKNIVGKEFKNRRIFWYIGVPLILISIFSIVALCISVSLYRQNNSQIHPQCACKKLMAENTPYQVRT